MLNVERRPLDITNDDRNRVSEDDPQTWHHSPRAQKAQESALTLVMLPCNYIFQLQIYHWNLLDLSLNTWKKGLFSPKSSERFCVAKNEA